jgi:SH3-like domain-containing protein
VKSAKNAPPAGLLRSPRLSLPRYRRIALVLAGAALSWFAIAADYRSIGDSGAVLFDGPSLKARPLYVAMRALPVEIISNDGTWFKVRDASGDLAWVDRKFLSDKRTVLVTVPIAEIRQKPDDTSPIAFQAAQGVGLEYTEQTGAMPGWIRVRHRDGSVGYVRISQIWGV